MPAEMSAESQGGATGRLLPEADGPEEWQRVVLDRAVDAHIDLLGPPARRRPRSAATPMPMAVEGIHEPDYPEFDLCAPLELPGPIRRRDLRAGPRARGRPIGAAPTCAALTARGARDRLDPLPDQGPRAADVRDADYWRFTPAGLRALLENAGLEVEVGTWGNRECVVGNLAAGRRTGLASASQRPRPGGSGLGLRSQPVLTGLWSQHLPARVSGYAEISNRPGSTFASPRLTVTAP